VSEASASTATSKGFDPVEWAARGYPTRAIWALVCACIGLFITPFAVAGLVIGVPALRRIERENARGRGIALAAIILSGIDLLMALVFVTFVLVAS